MSNLCTGEAYQPRVKLFIFFRVQSHWNLSSSAQMKVHTQNQTQETLAVQQRFGLGCVSGAVAHAAFYPLEVSEIRNISFVLVHVLKSDCNEAKQFSSGINDFFWISPLHHRCWRWGWTCSKLVPTTALQPAPDPFTGRSLSRPSTEDSSPASCAWSPTQEWSVQFTRWHKAPLHQ